MRASQSSRGPADSRRPRKDAKKRALGPGAGEFQPTRNADPLVQRLEVVGKHAAPALFNAAQMKRVPLKFLWWPIAKVQEGVGGKGRFYAISAAVLLAIFIGCMAFVPYPLKVEAKGELLPVEIAQIFPVRDGQVRQIRRKPGEKVGPNEAIVELFSADLDRDYSQALQKYVVQSARCTGSNSRSISWASTRRPLIAARSEIKEAETRAARPRQRRS